MKLIVVLATLLLLTIMDASALQIYETIGDRFRVSFDAPNNTNTIMKAWGGLEHNSSLFDLTKRDIQQQYNIEIMSNYSQRIICSAFILNHPFNTSDANTEKRFLENETSKYTRIYNRKIDGHDAVVARTSNRELAGPFEYRAMYWLDEVNGLATKGVHIFSECNSTETETMLNTIHIVELNVSAQKLKVNETVGGRFRASFHAPNNTFTIMKLWGSLENSNSLFGLTKKDIRQQYSIVALSDQPFQIIGCSAFILNNPFNTNDTNTEKRLLENETSRYIRIYDRKIDEYDAVVARTSNTGIRAIYWLDEVNKAATKGVHIFSNYNWTETETVLNTIHVAELKVEDHQS
jgi:hypothetical protein